MLSDEKFLMEFALERCRKDFPELAALTDQELLEARDTLYELAKLALESWAQQPGSKKSELVIDKSGEPARMKLWGLLH